jgi:hypothetical protein
VLLAATDQRSAEMRSMPATIEIDVHGRWDAVALLQRLNPYGPLPSALATIEESLAARQVEDATVRVDGRPYRPAGVN